MMTFLALEVELWVSVLSLSGLLHTEKDSMDVKKRKQILVTSSTTQRDVKKRVPSSVIEIERVTFSAFQAGGCSHCC